MNKILRICVACLAALLLHSCASPDIRLFDDVLSIKQPYQSKYVHIYCDESKYSAYADGKTLRGTILGLRISATDADTRRDTLVVFLPDGCSKSSANIREIPLREVDLPARLTAMIMNREQNVNRFLSYNNVTGIPEIRDVPIDSCGCTDIYSEGVESQTSCALAPCRPYFIEMRVAPGLFSYTDQQNVSLPLTRRALSYEIASGIKFGGIKLDLMAYLNALASVKVGMNFDVNCPCVRVDTLKTVRTVFQRIQAPEISLHNDSICITSHDTVYARTTDTVHVTQGASIFMGFDPILRLFARLDGDMDGRLRTELGLTPACDKWGVGLSYTSPMAVFNSYASAGSVDVMRPVVLLHVRYDFTRHGCLKPFAYAQAGTSLDDLTLRVWKYALGGDSKIDAAIDSIAATCSTCTVNGTGGSSFNLQLPSLRAALGGIPLTYGFGIGLEYPLFRLFDIAADFGYRSLAAGEAISFQNLDLPLYRRVGLWRLRLGITL